MDIHIKRLYNWAWKQKMKPMLQPNTQLIQFY